MSPRPRRPTTSAEYSHLVGTWWRCEKHGLTQDPILLGAHPYCPHEDCPLPARLAHSAMSDPVQESSEWRRSFVAEDQDHVYRPRARAAAPVADEPAAQVETTPPVPEPTATPKETPMPETKNETPATAGPLTPRSMIAEELREVGETTRERILARMRAMWPDMPDLMRRNRVCAAMSRGRAIGEWVETGGKIVPGPRFDAPPPAPVTVSAEALARAAEAAAAQVQTLAGFEPIAEDLERAAVAAEKAVAEAGDAIAAAQARAASPADLAPTPCVETPTEGAARINERLGAQTWIMDALRRGPLTRREAIAAWSASRPEMEPKKAQQNLDAAFGRLRKLGRTRTDGAGSWAIAEGAPKPVRRVLPPRRAEAAKGGSTTHAAASIEATKGETEPAPGVARLRAGSIEIRLTSPMRGRLERLVAEGFSGHDIAEVAEHMLARALVAFATA